MKKKTVETICEILLLIMFLGAALYGWIMIPRVNLLFEKILFTIFALFLSSIFLLFSLYRFKNIIIIKQIFVGVRWICGLIGGLLTLSQVVIGPIFVFTIVVGFQLILWHIITVVIGTNLQIGKITAYCVFLITLIIFSYRGVSILAFFHRKILQEDGEYHRFAEQLMFKIFSYLHLRRRAYELSILLYLISTIEKFLGHPLFTNLMWNSYSKVSLEILLSFIGVDAYVSTFMPKLIENERDQLKRIISKYYYNQGKGVTSDI